MEKIEKLKTKENTAIEEICDYLENELLDQDSIQK